MAPPPESVSRSSACWARACDCECDSKFGSNWGRPGIDPIDADTQTVASKEHPVKTVFLGSLPLLPRSLRNSRPWHTLFGRAVLYVGEQERQTDVCFFVSFSCGLPSDQKCARTEFVEETGKKKKTVIFFFLPPQTDRECRVGRAGWGTLCPSWWLGGGFLCKAGFCLAAEQRPADTVTLLINTHQLEVCPHWLLVCVCVCVCSFSICTGEEKTCCPTRIFKLLIFFPQLQGSVFSRGPWATN